MYWHSQNLNEDRQGNIKGPKWVHGRGWLRFNDRDSNDVDKGTIGVEWHLKSKSCGVSLSLGGDEHTISSSFKFPPVALYLYLEEPWKSELRQAILALQKKVGARLAFDISIHDWSLWWRFFRGSMEGWDRSVPKWKDGCFHFLDFLLGKEKHSSVPLSEEEVLIPMPEENYPATVKISRDIWERPRWFSKIRVMADIKMKRPVPVPGKGENSWDCGEDGIYGLSCSAETVEEAIGAVVKSALRDRRRHGGKGWEPEEKEVAAQA